jgi:hypothetical protein
MHHGHVIALDGDVEGVHVNILMVLHVLVTLREVGLLKLVVKVMPRSLLLDPAQAQLVSRRADR